MNTFLVPATVQITTTLYSSLFFTFVAVWLHKQIPKKDTIIVFWFIGSIIFGIFTFITSYAFLETLESINPTSSTTSMSVVWYVLLFLAFMQFTTLITGYSHKLYFTYNHENCDKITASLLQDDEPQYAVILTGKRLVWSVVCWLIICIISIGIPAAVYEMVAP